MGSGLLSVELYGHGTGSVGPVPVFFAKNPELAKRNLLVAEGSSRGQHQTTYLDVAGKGIRRPLELVHKPRDGHFR